MRFDQSGDSSRRQLYSLLNGIELPSFVKEAELDSQEGMAHFDGVAFADPVSRSFPINTPARTYVSHAFFMDKRAALARRYGPGYVTSVEQAIEKAAAVFGIQPELVKYVDVKASSQRLQKQAEAGFDCRMSTDLPDGTSVTLFQVKSAEDLTAAMGVFVRDIRRYPFPLRVKAAEFFVTSAAALGVPEIPDLIGKYAGQFFPDFRLVEPVLWHRESHIADPVLKSKYGALLASASTLKTAEELFSLLEKTSSLELQDTSGWNPRVVGVVGDPVDRICTLSLAKAAEMLDVVDMGGATFRISDLKRVSADIYKEAFGLDIDPSDSAVMRDVFPTLPLSDVALFRELSKL